ncbi:RNA-binding S4 domain-containing protein [Pseudahrensia aquimaris]|uniref:RNA-binding S4 domain-containing protein n=1 Tax=Pseudahrensia aquimaris TaxID=744461 RepID=A0ABW3FB36_9HYPH
MADDEEEPPILPEIVGDPTSKMRVDKWLWYTRTVKTRSLAQSLVKSGKIRINTVRIGSPSHTVVRDDVLTVTLDRQIKILKVRAPGTRRGPAPEAQLLYEDLSPPPVKRDPTGRPLKQAVREEGAGRPTKKERRELSRFRSQAGEQFD